MKGTFGENIEKKKMKYINIKKKNFWDLVISFHSFTFLFLSYSKTAFNSIALAITDDSFESLTWNFQYSPNYKQFERFAQLPCILALDILDLYFIPEAYQQLKPNEFQCCAD